MSYGVFVVVAVLASGALAMFLAAKLFAEKSQRGAQIVIFLLSMGFFNGVIYPDYIVPKQRAENIVALTQALPFLQNIKQHKPILYKKWIKVITQAVEQGATEQQAVALMVQQLKTEVTQELIYASDDTLYNYMQVMLNNMQELQAHSPQVCYQFLYPDPNKPLVVSNYLSEQAQQQTLAAMEQVIISPKYALATGNVHKKALQQVVQKLNARFGRDLQALNQPYTTKVSKAKLCEMNIAYQQALLEFKPSMATTLFRLSLKS